MRKSTDRIDSNRREAIPEPNALLRFLRRLLHPGAPAKRLPKPAPVEASVGPAEMTLLEFPTSDGTDGLKTFALPDKPEPMPTSGADPSAEESAPVEETRPEDMTLEQLKQAIADHYVHLSPRPDKRHDDSGGSHDMHA